MLMREVKDRAKALGIKTWRVKKTDLIRAIQEKEGNFPCFATADGWCDQSGCCFRKDCLEKDYQARASIL